MKFAFLALVGALLASPRPAVSPNAVAPKPAPRPSRVRQSSLCVVSDDGLPLCVH